MQGAKIERAYPFSKSNPTHKSITIHTCYFKLKIKVIIQRGTLFITVFIRNMEHGSFITIPSKTILICTQDGVTHPIICIRFKTTIVRAIGIKIMV